MTTGAMQSSCQIITTNKPIPSFLQAGCPSYHPTNSVKALKGESFTFHGLAYPKLSWGLPTLSLTINSSWLPWRRVAMPFISPLMPVPQLSLILQSTIQLLTVNAQDCNIKHSLHFTFFFTCHHKVYKAFCGTTNA